MKKPPAIGTPVFSAEGDLLGTVREMEDERFKVDVPFRRDYWIDIDNVKRATKSRVILKPAKMRLPEGTHATRQPPGGSVSSLKAVALPHHALAGVCSRCGGTGGIPGPRRFVTKTVPVTETRYVPQPPRQEIRFGEPVIVPQPPRHETYIKHEARTEWVQDPPQVCPACGGKGRRS